MTTADEKMRKEFEQWYVENAFDYPSNPIGSRDCGLQRKAWQASAAQYSERIKELEQQVREQHQNQLDLIEQRAELQQQNEQLQSQASSACEFYQSIIDANYRTWDCGLDNAEEFVRWIKSRAVHALSLSATQTAEAYKRRIQAEALYQASDKFHHSGASITDHRQIAVELRRMASELKGELR